MALATLSYRNRTLGKTETVNIILPEAELGSGPFPVIYLLHGIGDDHTDWVRRTRIEEYVKALPLMVVMPTTPWQSMYIDAVGYPAAGSVQGAKAATAIAHDLVDFIDARFRTRAEATGRAVCGLSMGGYGALHLAFSHPNRFGAAASHSGALLYGHLDADEYPESESGSLGRLLTLRNVGPKAKGGPYDLLEQARRLAPQQRPAIRFDCGTEDFLFEQSEVFHRHLLSLGYEHEYAVHPGAHTWDYWDTHIQESIDFFIRKLGWLSSVGAL